MDMEKEDRGKEYKKIDSEKGRRRKMKTGKTEGGSNSENSEYAKEINRTDSPQRAEKRQREMDARKLAELTEAFHLFDFDRDGVISFSDLKRVYASLDKGNMDEEEIKNMISEGMDPMNFDAFIKLMEYKTLDMDDEEILVEALSQWDYGTGLISEERIKHDLMTWGDRFTEEEAEAALEHAPFVLTKNKEKMINYVQFCNDLCGFRRMKTLLNEN